LGGRDRPPHRGDCRRVATRRRPGQIAACSAITCCAAIGSFTCVATLLLQPKPPSLILLDEPELGLHPFAIHQAADMLASSDRQIILSTQSVTLLDQMAIDDVLVAENQGGHTTLQRPSLDGLEQWLEIYSVGEMWEKSFLDGRPR
jgi:energy-coupling factor transporter ATP-binding protein EcfA2